MKRKGVERDQAAKELIQKVYERDNGVLGYRQIQLFLLHDHGVWMNHKKVLRIMLDLGIRSRIRRIVVIMFLLKEVGWQKIY
ncbi:transposase [Paenibacillus sp. FSL R10-2782]|uniref:transposase n=1 Tax=Paenibacillus sp. FSL R10-2782 TaxID=2954661 RepID=UPI0031598AA3